MDLTCWGCKLTEHGWFAASVCGEIQAFRAGGFSKCRLLRSCAWGSWPTSLGPLTACTAALEQTELKSASAYPHGQPWGEINTQVSTSSYYVVLLKTGIHSFQAVLVQLSPFPVTLSACPPSTGLGTADVVLLASHVFFLVSPSAE